MTTERTALVLGATGGIGGAVARRLLRDGWRVRALHRDPERVRRAGDGLGWRQGDAMVPVEVARAAEGTGLIVHAVNPPGYRDWDRLVLPMLDSTLAAAREAGARLLVPGTVYNYGPDARPRIAEGAPQNPLTVKGRVRVAMERRLEAAAAAGTRVLIVRAGDYFGPGTGRNSWFSGLMVRPGRPVGTVRNPGTPGVGHQWAYLPDVAETMVRLVAAGDALEPFCRVHMDGHWDRDGTRMVAAIRRVLGRPDLRVRRLPWSLLRLVAPVWPFAREVAEIRPLWREPVRLDNARLVALLGAEPHTPLDEAVRATLAGLGCLDGIA
ncbi:MAG: NAD-dependent epimerase/dehydratase family protein [Methylobacterium frigidaeris]